MKKFKQVFKILLIFAVVGLLAFLIFRPDPNALKEQSITYSEFINLVNNDQINNVNMNQSSTQISAKSNDAPDILYLVEVPDKTVLTEYLQGKILEGKDIVFEIEKQENNAYLFSIIWGIIMIVMMFSVFMSLFRLVFRKGPSAGPESFSPINPFVEKKFEKAVKSDYRFSDVAGLDEEKAELEEIIDFLKNPTKYTNLGAKIPKGVLLDGQPGTGKTLLAKAVAGEAGVSFVATSGSEFIETYVGVGAARMRSLFKEARANSPCIIFIDEIDAIGGKRENYIGHSEQNQTIEQLLTELDGFNGRDGIIIIAATNRASSLDSALTRPGRFDRKITVNLPDVKGREDILKLHSRNKPFDESVDFKKIAYNTAGFSGAELENLLNEAALSAARKEHQIIDVTDIDEAIMKITVGLKKAGRVVSAHERILTANHEAGHAIVSLFLKTQASIKEVCIIPRGSAGGYTLHQTVEDKNYHSKKELTERLAVLLGGRAAEKIVLQDISSGASNDLKVATQIARDMIIYYGMDDQVGPISFADATPTELNIFGQDTLSNIGNKITEIVKTAETEATQLINEHRQLLDELVEKLLAQETVSGEELQAMYIAYMDNH